MKTLRVEIDIKGPVLTAGLSTPAYGVDTGFQRDLADRFIFPGTLIKGIVVHKLREISAAAPAHLPEEKCNRWFGRATDDARESKSPTPAALEPCRGIVRFGDFRLDAAESKRLTRIAVDIETGSVARGMLQVLETPVGYGEKAIFCGDLMIAGDDDEAGEVGNWVRTALELESAIGSAKSAGFGHIENIRVQPVQKAGAAARVASDPAASSGDPVGYALEFDEPLLVASQAISGNLFKSSEEIPGGVVKGALARAIEMERRMGALGEALDRMIIRHAKPARLADNGTPRPLRPHCVPLSIFSIVDLTTGETSDILDAAESGNDPEEYAGQLLTSIAFPPDWKNREHARLSVLEQQGHTAEFEHDVRTRTAINPEQGTAATSQLFSRIALNPQGHVWLGDIARGDADPAAFAEILDIMARGLPGIGKTGATAAVGWFKPEPRTAAPLAQPAPGRRRWRIALETDALLHGPDAVFTHAGVGPEERLAAQYRDYIAHAIAERLGSGGAIEPGELGLRFFARQRWVGGYQALRFPTKRKGHYYPHLVTEAGSVFVLDGPETATAAIESFVTRGLPLPAGVPPADWEYKRSPFVPQNGYGEVSIGDYFEWRRPDA